MFLRALFLHNFWLKLSSVVLATLIWLTVWASIKGESPLAQRVVSMEVEFPRRPVLVMTGTGELQAQTIEPPDVSVLVRGPAAIVRELSEQDIQVFLNLHERPDSTGKVGLAVRVPPGVTDVVVVPKRVTVRPSDRP